MSTDFSIRPVGAPVAPAFPPASNAAISGVPTQLPASQSVTPTDAGTASNNNAPGPSGLSQQAYFDTAAAAVVFQSVDDLTGQVVSQYPDDAMLARRAYFHSLDQKDASTGPLATDVTA
jgi:hypothetical protein